MTLVQVNRGTIAVDSLPAIARTGSCCARVRPEICVSRAVLESLADLPQGCGGLAPAEVDNAAVLERRKDRRELAIAPVTLNDHQRRHPECRAHVIDEIELQWTVDELDKSTTGFAVERVLTRDGHARPAEWLENYSSPGPGPHQLGVRQPSEAWPFRRFSWTDHSVGPGDEVSYRVVPVLAGAPALREEMASQWSVPLTIGPSGATAYSAYFNRGFVISQFVSRYLDEHYPLLGRAEALKRFKADIGDDLENRVREFLSGHLRQAMVRLLDEVRDGDGEVCAALFELGDKELLASLIALGSRAHIVLANGSIEKKPNETTAQARTRDENAAAREQLRDAGVDVGEVDRFVSPGALAHNKFLVATTAAGEATKVWTGSTNWTTTGLCTL